MPKTPDYFAGKTICKIPFHSVHIARNTLVISLVKRMDAVEHGLPIKGITWLVSSNDLLNKKSAGLPKSACTTMAPVCICRSDQAAHDRGSTDID